MNHCGYQTYASYLISNKCITKNDAHQIITDCIDKIVTEHYIILKGKYDNKINVLKIKYTNELAIYNKLTVPEHITQSAVKLWNIVIEAHCCASEIYIASAKAFHKYACGSNAKRYRGYATRNYEYAKQSNDDARQCIAIRNAKTTSVDQTTNTQNQSTTLPTFPMIPDFIYINERDDTKEIKDLIIFRHGVIV